MSSDHDPAADAKLLAQYRALREGCALLERSGVSQLELTGEDRRRFLNGLVTCDVRALEPGRGVYGFLTDARGHILADVVVRALEERLWLELPSSTAQPIADHLRKYVVADRVEVLPTDVVALTLAGRRAEELMVSLVGADGISAGPWRHWASEVLGQPLVVSSDGRLGVPAFTFWVSGEAAAELTTRLLERSQPPPVPVGLEAAEVVRVESGLPRFGRDFGPENLPQETGIDGAVSYEKGCYLGQEIIARLHYRGRAARQLRRVRIEGPEVPPPQTPLVYEGREAGRITSAVASPESGRVSGLAMLQRRACAIGTELTREDGETVEAIGQPAGFG